MRLLADVLRGLRRVEPRLDIVRVQDTAIAQAADPVVLEWAANEDRILLTHDVQVNLPIASSIFRFSDSLFR